MGTAKVAKRPLGCGSLRRMVCMSRMGVVLQAAHAVATRSANRSRASQQRQRCGEQRDDYDDGLGATHCGQGITLSRLGSSMQGLGLKQAKFDSGIHICARKNFAVGFKDHVAAQTGL